MASYSRNCLIALMILMVFVFFLTSQVAARTYTESSEVHPSPIGHAGSSRTPDGG
ncbi:hypothetical protein Dsin_008154 [Dipteronia sinensis]|uniref:Transmembrane protein n=1 Tax=Dipteronia sinensis TaxID=43782 RepID=A0AAE0EHT1_9ROSI|nr:hypothetical protein Dsin_008154 [Dipteronia sinensis]